MNDVSSEAVRHTAPTRPRGLDRAMIVVFLALVAIPLLGLWPAQERLRWRAAAALLAYERDGDRTVLAELAALAQQLPNDMALRLRISEILLKENRISDAAALIEPLAEHVVQATRPIDWASYQILRHYATLLWLRGDDQGSIETVKQIESRLPRSMRGSEASTNELSYYRALTRLELDVAEEDMVRLIYRKRTEFNTRAPRFLSYRATIITAGALLAFDVGQGESALHVLAPEIDDARNVAAARSRELLQSVYRELENPEPWGTESRADLDRLRQFEAQGRSDLAALLIARAYLLDRLGRAEESLRDRREVQEMGIDADGWLAASPGHRVLLEIVAQGGSLLDTLAYTLYGQRQLGQALREQQVAIWALEIFVRSFDTPLQNTTAMGIDAATSRAQSRHSLAVLYSHHAEMLEAFGLHDEAAAEMEKVEALGFSRDVLLY